jgi:hypothetical protein
MHSDAINSHRQILKMVIPWQYRHYDKLSRKKDKILHQHHSLLYADDVSPNHRFLNNHASTLLLLNGNDDRNMKRDLASNNTMTNSNILSAAYLWVKNPSLALSKYGNITLWDTSRVTNMTSLFGYYNPFGWESYWSKSFNADLSKWNTIHE